MTMEPTKALDPKALARKLAGLHEHLTHQPLTHADSVDMETLRQASAYLSALAEQPAAPSDHAGLVERLRKAKDALFNGEEDDWRAGAAAIDEALAALSREPEAVAYRGSAHSLSFEDGLFRVNPDGSGEISFTDEALSWGEGEDSNWRSQKLPASEVHEIQAWLNRITQPAPQPAPSPVNGEVLRNAIYNEVRAFEFGDQFAQSLADAVMRTLAASPPQGGSDGPA